MTFFYIDLYFQLLLIKSVLNINYYYVYYNVIIIIIYNYGNMIYDE